MAYSYPGGSLKQEISAILILSCEREISGGTKYKITTVPGRTRRKPKVKINGVQGPGLNPPREILLGSALFGDST